MKTSDALPAFPGLTEEESDRLLAGLSHVGDFQLSIKDAGQNKTLTLTIKLPDGRNVTTVEPVLMSAAIVGPFYPYGRAIVDALLNIYETVNELQPNQAEGRESATGSGSSVGSDRPINEQAKG